MSGSGQRPRSAPMGLAGGQSSRSCSWDVVARKGWRWQGWDRLREGGHWGKGSRRGHGRQGEGWRKENGMGGRCYMAVVTTLSSGSSVFS